MADEKKKISLGGIDNAAEEKGSFIKTVWQFVKFLVVSGLVTIIQLVLANVLPLIFDSVTATLPGFLQGIFKPDVIFDASTAQGAKQIAKYVVGGVVTWGYLLPFFLSNLIANIYGFYQNKKTTFKSDAPWYNFAIYIVLLNLVPGLVSWYYRKSSMGLVKRSCKNYCRPCSRLCTNGSSLPYGKVRSSQRKEGRKRSLILKRNTVFIRLSQLIALFFITKIIVFAIFFSYHSQFYKY